MEDENDLDQKDDSFEDDLDDAFGDEEDIFGDSEDEGEKDKEDDKKSDKDKDEKKKDSSAIFQKQKYREKLKVALDRIKQLENKKDDSGTLSDEEKKEKAANDFLVSKIREVLKEVETSKETQDREAEEEFQDELDDVLDEHTDLTEKQVLDVCEELDVSPKQAVKIIEREAKLNSKEKPKLPQPKRGSPTVKADEDKKSDKPKTFDDINRSLKKAIRDKTL